MPCQPITGMEWRLGEERVGQTERVVLNIYALLLLLLSLSVVSDSVQPHKRQPTRLRRPWDSPGKNIGVGCHFLLQCMKVRSESEVAQSCPTLRNLMDHSSPGSSVHGISQARALEWVAIMHYHVWNRELVGSCCIAWGAPLDALWWCRWVEWGAGGWEGSSRSRE